MLVSAQTVGRVQPRTTHLQLDYIYKHQSQRKKLEVEEDAASGERRQPADSDSVISASKRVSGILWWPLANPIILSAMLVSMVLTYRGLWREVVCDVFGA